VNETKLLKDGKNLLAFSGGIDSSALFFMLLEEDISFDIAIVDYGIREQSKEEISYAKELAHRYNLKCYTAKAPKFESHFEQNAREFRYRFFEDIVSKYGYDNLLTAHQLNDQLEWLLMRLGKGSGVSELIGLEPISQRDGYTLVRPLLGYTKDELLEYLQQNNHRYFVDQSNSDQKYERNRFRHNFSDPLIRQYASGIKKSFEYLRADKEILEDMFEILSREQKLYIIKLHNTKLKAKAVDIALKRLGYLMTSAQRAEIEKENSLVIGGKWAVEYQDSLLYIAPYCTTKMPKEFKEQCRINKIPPKIRGYIFKNNIPIPSNP